MTHPAAYVVTGVVIAVAAIVAFFSTRSGNKTKPMHYSSGRPRDNSPPSSPLPSAFTSNLKKRRKSPECQSSLGSESARKSIPKPCENCGESPYMKISPCNHESLCKGCFSNYLETNDKCPTCNGRIDSCSPTIPPFGKCQGCRKFTKLINFLPCSHSLALCIKCFEEQGRSYKECPECKSQIRGYEPITTRIGICKVCEEFTRFATFQPCGHADFCKKHAEQYLRNSDQECLDCGNRVMAVV